MKSLPPLKSLQFFAEAGRLLSFKKAAESLNVTQAAISQQIRQLEERLGQKLFERSARTVQLTDAGRRMLPLILRGFEALSDGVDTIQGDPRSDVLRISTLHSFSSSWLIPRLQEFQQMYPNLMVQLAPSNDLIDFKQGDIDVAIRLGGGGYSGLHEEKIFQGDMVLVASPSLLRDIDVNNATQVLSLPRIEDTTKGVQDMFTSCCKQYGVDAQKLRPILQSENAVPLIEAALIGQGYLMIDSCLITEHLRVGSLIRLLGFSQQSPYSLYLVAPEAQFNWQKVKQFKSWFTPKVRGFLQA